MEVLALAGRLLFAIIFFFSGVSHLTKAEHMAGYAGAKGVPSPRLGVLGSGVLMILGALMVLVGLWGDLGALLLVVCLVPMTLLMHAFWKESDPMAAQMEQIHFLKNTAMTGAALILLVFFANAGDDMGFTLTGPLF